MQTPTPVARRRAATMGPMQIILDSASQHPPPAIWGAGTGGGGGGGSGSVGDLTHSVTPQLISVNDQTLDLAILCDGNTILATNLVEPDSTDSHHHRSSTRMVLSTPDGACAGRNNGLCRITFATDGGAPRPGDELVPSDSIPPNLVMQGLEFSPSGSSLLVWGEKYVAVARAPRGGGGGSGAGGASGRWRWTLVDMSGYAVDILRQRVVKASWHPASDNCITLLTVDDGGSGGMAAGGGANAARAFVMLHVPGRERPEQVFPIPDGPSKSLPIGMDYGKGAGWQRFAIWIARRDGSVAALCPVVPQTARVDAEELVELWAAIGDKLVAARWERANGDGGESQRALDAEVAHLEQQQAWLRENFKHVLEDENHMEPEGSRAIVSTSTGNKNDKKDEDKYEESSSLAPLPRGPPHHPALQDNIVAGRNASNAAASTASPAKSGDASDKGRRGEDAGPACGLVVLGGAGRSSDAGAAVAEPPTVLAVAYRAGVMDLVLVPAGVTPRWADRAGTKIACAASSAVLESLDLSERSTENSRTGAGAGSGGSGGRRRQGLALSAGTAPWSVLAATHCRLTTITVTWAAAVENGASLARERAARGDIGGRLETDLRALLRERPDSSVAEVLFVPPTSPAGRIVGFTPVANPQVGHLVLARLAEGRVELVNVSVVAKKATEVASAAKRARAQETPGKGDMVPPFEAAVQKAEDALERLGMSRPLGSSDRLPSNTRMSGLDKRGVQAFDKEAHRLLGGGVVLLEKLHYKTNARLQTLREVYDHQAGLISGLSKDVSRLRTGQEDAEERLEQICHVADEQRSRSAAVLMMVQATRPDVSPAERAFIAEMKDMQGYADRRKATLEPAAHQIEEILAAEREVEDSLVREAQGLDSAGGAGLSERESQDVWNMLQADRERIRGLSRRLEAAQARMAELGVHQEE